MVRSKEQARGKRQEKGRQRKGKSTAIGKEEAGARKAGRRAQAETFAKSCTKIKPFYFGRPPLLYTADA